MIMSTTVQRVASCWRRAGAKALVSAVGPGMGIFVLALIVRLGYVAADLPVPAQDTSDYDEIAANLLAGEGFVARGNWYGYALRSWRAPFYPFFLAAVYGIWGHSHLAVRLLQSLVGAGAAVLVYRLALLAVPRAALLAGVLAALYGPLAVSATEVMTETWYTFWSLLSVLLLWPVSTAPASAPHHGPHAHSPARAILGGAVLGLAALTRPVGLLLWPALALTAWSTAGMAGLRRALTVGAATLCVLAPWTARNYHVHHALVPIATHGGFIIARSNADAPAWRQEHGWGIRPSVFARTPSEVERDRIWLRQGLDWIRSHPKAYLGLAAERFMRLWYFLRPDYNFWFMLMLPFAVAGLWHLGGRRELRLIVIFLILSVLVFSLVLYGAARFRLPLEPLLLILSAGTVVDGWRRLGPRVMSTLLAAAIALNLLLDWQDEVVRLALVNLLEQGGLL